MTGICIPMPMDSMDNRGSMYPSQLSYMGNYISPSPSIYPASYETSPSLPASYTPVDTIHQRTSQDWTGQDITLFSHSERAIAKERRREQNRASQRAYRKRKEDTVKGLYESIKDLRKNADALRAENVDLRDRTEMLQSELRKMHEENQRLLSRSSSIKSCIQCSEAGVPCSKNNTVCSRCEECGLTCSSPSPELTSRHPTVEASDHEDTNQESLHTNLASERLWYETNTQAPLISKPMTIDTMPGYSITSFDEQDFHARHHNPYEVDDEEDSLHGSTQENYTSLLKPRSRQIYRTQSLQTIASPSDQTRPRSTSVYGPLQP